MAATKKLSTVIFIVGLTISIILAIYPIFNVANLKPWCTNSSVVIKQVEQSTINNHNEDPKRLCSQNPFAQSLSISLSDYGKLMDEWLDNEVLIERDLVYETRGFQHSHKRFDAFQVMGSCNRNCLGGDCHHLDDGAKVACGVNKNSMIPPCVVYSIGSNNDWKFEMDILQNTQCIVHTFDCTGPIGRYKIPNNASSRLFFHHICLGTTNKKENSLGEFWTLQKAQNTLGHNQIDLLKVDIEGYEWPLFLSWPELTDVSSSQIALPMQILVEVHYQSQMKELAKLTFEDFKFTTDMVRLQSHLIKMGYVVVVRNDNELCLHCTELTLLRARCPPTPHVTG